MSKIIGICGYAQVGKSEVANYIESQHGGQVRSIGDFLNEFVMMVNPKVSCKSRYVDYISERGYEGAKAAHPEIRDLLIRTGDALRKTFGEDILLRAMLENVHGLVVVPNIRHDNEFAAVCEAGGEMWRVNRPGVGPARDHPTETSHTSWNVHAEINNDGSLAQLHEDVDLLIQALK